MSKFTRTPLYMFSDIPSAPVGPLEVTYVKEDSALLSWKPPRTDGGTPLTGYIIESRQPISTTWKKVGEVKPDVTQFTADRLLTGNDYYFRVKAINKEGDSEPLDTTEPVKIRKKIGEF